MAYNSISIKHYIKSHLELQREITLIVKMHGTSYITGGAA